MTHKVLYLDRVTEQNGEILWEGLEPGVYSLTETATLDDHILSLREHHVELFPGKTGTVVLENDRRPDLTVHKRDADTGEAVPGAVFLVKSADGHSVQEVKTGQDGTAAVENLLPGCMRSPRSPCPRPICWTRTASSSPSIPTGTGTSTSKTTGPRT